MTQSPTEGKCANPAGGLCGMPLALSLNEGLDLADGERRQTGMCSSLNASGLAAGRPLDPRFQPRTLRMGFHRGRLWELRVAVSSIQNPARPLPMPKEGGAVALVASVLWHELVAILRRSTSALRAKCSHRSEPSLTHHFQSPPPPYAHTGLDE